MLLRTDILQKTVVGCPLNLTCGAGAIWEREKGEKTGKREMGISSDYRLQQ